MLIASLGALELGERGASRFFARFLEPKAKCQTPPVSKRRSPSPRPSPRGRGSPPPRPEKANASGTSAASLQFTLSHGERAGVRGKERCKTEMPLQTAYFSLAFFGPVVKSCGYEEF